MKFFITRATRWLISLVLFWFWFWRLWGAGRSWKNILYLPVASNMHCCFQKYIFFTSNNLKPASDERLKQLKGRWRKLERYCNNFEHSSICATLDLGNIGITLQNRNPLTLFWLPIGQSNNLVFFLSFSVVSTVTSSQKQCSSWSRWSRTDRSDIQTWLSRQLV